MADNSENVNERRNVSQDNGSSAPGAQSNGTAPGIQVVCQLEIFIYSNLLKLMYCKKGFSHSLKLFILRLLF